MSQIHQTDDLQPNEPEVSIKVDCPECLRLPKPPIRPFVRPERFTDPGRVNGWCGLTTESKYTHQVDENATLAYYVLPQETSCIFGHGHKDGRIVEVRCRLQIRLGHICARKTVAGYSEMQAFVANNERHLDKLNTIRSVPLQCEERLVKLVPEIKKAADYQKARTDLTEGREMKRRAGMGAKGAEVIVEQERFNPNSDKGTRVEQLVLRIEGLSFWTTDFDSHWANRVLNEAHELVESAKAVDADDVDAVNKIANRCKHVERDIGKMEELVRLAGIYLSSNNRRVIAQALKGRVN